MTTPANPKFRMFNACLGCGRQYDVSFLTPGARVRCECGIHFAAEFKQPRTPRALKCSNCGGVLVDGARECGYCNAQITIEERGLSSVCPKCYARMSSDARFCMECGIAIEIQALAALPAEAECPRCQCGLRARSVGSSNVSECMQCGGLWLSEDHFASVCERTDEQELAARALAQTGPPPRAGEAHPVRYLPCVVCKDLMLRRNYSGNSGIIIDVCRDHGVWLDHAELQGILGFIRAGGLDRARERQLTRLKEQERRTKDASNTMRVDLALGDSFRGRGLNGTLGDWVVWALDGILG